jgi:hypothetical protein
MNKNDIQNLPIGSRSTTSRYKKNLDEQSRVFEAYFLEPKTMKMVSVSHEIDRANICRYNRNFRIEGKIKSVKKGFCPITKHFANFWTTNPKLFPKETQLNLF